MKPIAPAAARSATWVSVEEERSSAQSPWSTIALPAIASRLAWKTAPSATPGSVLGMSSTVVTPPAAAAAVRVPKSSFAGKPGSRPWTWASIAPGSTQRPPASTTSGPFGWAQGSRRATRPPSTWRSTSWSPSGV